eukprot:g4427.t1
MHRKRVTMLCLGHEDNSDDTASEEKEQFEGRYWRQNGRSLSFTSCAVTKKLVSSKLKYYQISSSTSNQTEDSPRNWKCSYRGRPIRCSWLRTMPFFDRAFWKKKPRERVSAVSSGELEFTERNFLQLQEECQKLKQERERLLASVHENDIKCEMYANRLTSILENNNAQLKQASESLRKMESVIAYLQTVISAKDLEIQFLKRSSKSTSPTSSSITTTAPFPQ